MEFRCELGGFGGAGSGAALPHLENREGFYFTMVMAGPSVISPMM